MAKGIILAEFGNRTRQVCSILKHLRLVTDLPIVIYTDHEYELNFQDVSQVILTDLSWKDHRRYYNRNNDYWKIKAAMSEFDEVLVVDDDMRIVNEDFIQGFDLAKRFGICLPMQARVYFGIDLEIGADVSDSVKQELEDIPYYLTANNMGVIFINNKSRNVWQVLNCYLDFMQEYPCRGPVAMAATYYNCCYTPYLLPEEWCVCRGYAKYKSRKKKRIDPMILHIGHKDVNQWFNKSEDFKSFRDEQ